MKSSKCSCRPLIRNVVGLVVLILLAACCSLSSLPAAAQNCSPPSTIHASGCPGYEYTLSASGGSNIQYFIWLDAAEGGTNFNGTTNGPTQSTYTNIFGASVTYWVSAYCTDGSETARVPVSFISTDTNVDITPSEDPMSVASPGDLDLTASGGSSYKWLPGHALGYEIATGSVFSPSAGGIYYLKGLNACTNWKTDFIEVNFLPIADAGPDQIIALPSTSFDLYGSGSDPDGDAITFLWTQVSGPSVTLSNTGTNALQLTNISSGTYTFQLQVTDAHGNLDTDQVAVTASTISNNTNYVLEDVVKVPGKSESQISSLTETEKGSSYNYLTSTGNTLQVVQRKASPSVKDIVLPAAYDELGRTKKTYLAMGTTQNTGVPISDPLGSAGYVGSGHYNFYNSGGNGIPQDAQPFSDVTFESSPLGRIIQRGSFGVGFQPGEAGDVTIGYGTNLAGDVRIWMISSGLPVSNATWEANLLSVITSTDPQGVQSQVITNRQGLKLLERVKIDATNWAETYYVYDSKNNLTFILPPELMRILKDPSFRDPTLAEINSWAYQNVYDNENRMVESKAPGADWIYTIYDKRDRVVLSQDGVQRASNEWSYTKYDELDRPLISGIYRPGNSITRADMQANIDALNGNLGYTNIIPEPHVVSGVKVGMDLTITAYEGIDEYNAINSIVMKPGFTFTAGTTSTAFVARIDNGTGTTADVYPSSNDEALVISFYDTYDNCNVCKESSYQFTPESWSVSSNEPYATFQRLKGQPVASSVKVLNLNQWLHTVGYYNRHGEVIQTTSTNHMGGVNRFSSLPDFAGKILSTIQVTGEVTIKRRFDYDHAGRVLKAHHQVNNESEVVLMGPEYNELGQQIGSNLHGMAGGAYLQSIDYRADIRGWTTRINNSQIAGNMDSGDPAPDYFGMEYAYHNSFGSGSAVRYDGYFSAIRWKDDLSNKERLYNFGYNNQGFLTGAGYKGRNNDLGSTWTTNDGMYSENNLTYDRNGNLQTLNRNAGSTIDVLNYDYAGGNQLMRVEDVLFIAEGFNELNRGSDDYAYDLNGRLTEDKNKGIADIDYNHLNLMEKVTFNDNSWIDYIYDASGTKLKTYYYNSAGQEISRIEYLENFVYVDGTLQSIRHEAGRVVQPSYANLVSNPSREAGTTDGFVTIGNVTITAEFENGETYVKAVCNESTGTPGITKIGQTINGVNAGENYAFKILGYQSVGISAKLYVRGSNGDILWPGAALPDGASNENYVTSNFTIPAGVTWVEVGVKWDVPANGNTMFINRVALYKTDYEYQYFLNDHQGNVRVVLQTSPNSITSAATMETENFDDENLQFLNIQPSFIEVNPVANATPGGNEVIRLNTSYSVGPARSFKVFPGDVIDASVKAYYASGSGLSQATAVTIATAVNNVLSPNQIVDGVVTDIYEGDYAGIALSPFQGSTKPSAFLNYILFDQSYVPIAAQSQPLGGTAGVSHTVQLPTINVKELGYLFVYLSYDNTTDAMVYFDDLKIVYNESPVIQVNGYYPYGMTAYSWVRDGEEQTREKYQGKEYDSLTQWHDFHARQYDAAVGRWLVTDPQNQFVSPYNGMGNNPVMVVDPNGEVAWFVPIIIGAVIGGTTGGIQAANSGDYSILGGIWRGALIGGLAGAGGAGVSALGGGAMLAGAAGGAIAGSGFSGLATGWDGQAMLTGGLIGAASGFVGGGVASAIGGGSGAFFGGIASDLTNQLLSTGDVDLMRAGAAGAISFGMYHGMSYASYRLGGGNNTLDGQKLTYRQFAKINRAYQKSRFWRKEYGVYLNNDGSARFVPKNDRNMFQVDFLDPRSGDFGEVHTHWAKSGVRWVDVDGDGGGKMYRYRPSKTYPDYAAHFRTQDHFHSPQDLYSADGLSIVVGRTGSSYFVPGMTNGGLTSSRAISPDPFVRWFMLPWWLR